MLDSLSQRLCSINNISKQQPEILASTLNSLALFDAISIVRWKIRLRKPQDKPESYCERPHRKPPDKLKTLGVQPNREQSEKITSVCVQYTEPSTISTSVTTPKSQSVLALFIGMGETAMQTIQYICSSSNRSLAFDLHIVRQLNLNPRIVHCTICAQQSVHSKLICKLRTTNIEALSIIEPSILHLPFH